MAVIRNMTGTLRNRHDGATQVQRHETDPGEPPRRLRAPGMPIAFRVATSSRTRLRISAAAARCAVALRT